MGRFVRAAIAVGAIAGIGIAGIGCGGLIGPDPEGTRLLREAIAHADPAIAVTMLFTGGPEAGLVRFGCADAIGGVGRSDPSMRTVMIANALIETTKMCPAACMPRDQISAMSSQAPEQRIAAAGAACDQQGPDPLFAGPYAPLRPYAKPLEYLATRMLVDRAIGADPEFASALPNLAVGLVLWSYEGAETGAKGITSSRKGMDLGPVAENLEEAMASCPSPPSAPVGLRLVFDPKGEIAGRADVQEDPCIGAWADGLQIGAAEDGTYAVVDVVWAPGGGSGER